MDLIEGIATRHSTRAFKSTPVPEELVAKILQAVSNSPSYTNTQPWEVAVAAGTKRDELSRKLVALASAGTKTNPDIPLPSVWPPALEKRSTDHRNRRNQFLGIAIDENLRRASTLGNYNFYGAPCALFLFMERSLGMYSAFDMGLFAHGITLAAHALGLGTCLQAMLANYPDPIREVLGIPNTKALLIGISLGYPDTDARVNAYRAVKLSPDDFAKW